MTRPTCLQQERNRRRLKTGDEGRGEVGGLFICLFAFSNAIGPIYEIVFSRGRHVFYLSLTMCRYNEPIIGYTSMGRTKCKIKNKYVYLVQVFQGLLLDILTWIIFFNKTTTRNF